MGDCVLIHATKNKEDYDQKKAEVKRLHSDWNPPVADLLLLEGNKKGKATKRPLSVLTICEKPLQEPAGALAVEAPQKMQKKDLEDKAKGLFGDVSTFAQ